MIEKLPSITSAQIRAGRALVRISAEKLAELAGLGITTIHRAEAAEGMPSMTRANMDAVRRALEAVGVRFTEDGGVSPALAASSAAQFDVCEQKDGKWQVIVSLPGRQPMNVSDFDGEAAAKAWVQRDSAAWLRKLSG